MDTRGKTVSLRPTGRQRPGEWAGYASCVCGLLFAVPNFYWALGGTIGLDTLGEWAVQLAATRDPWVMAVLGITAVLKVSGGLFGLALVQPWGRAFPRWMMLTAGWGGTLLLILYGGLQVGAQALVAIGVIPAPANMDWWAFYWHLFLWSPWFLVWGILLGLAVWHYQRSSRTRQAEYN
ncbi:MAG: DUF3995 domain-containing protein [Ardenticatenaceae bacterium]